MTREYSQWWIPNYICVLPEIKTTVRSHNISNANVSREVLNRVYYRIRFFQQPLALIPEPARFALCQFIHGRQIEKRLKKYFGSAYVDLTKGETYDPK